MSTSRMNLEEIITSAKYRTNTKKLVSVCVIALVVCSLAVIITAKYELSLLLKTILATFTMLSLVSIHGAFSRWGEKSIHEHFVLKNKILDMTVSELKKFYKTYGGAPISAKRVDEKILLEEIMIDISMNYMNQGEFIEPFQNLIEKGFKHKTRNVYTFIAMTTNPSSEDRVKVYILDIFLSAKFIDNVKIGSIEPNDNFEKIYALC